jgi:hypothetical protein
MARPKGKLFALLAVFAAIGLVAASGAFTTVEADRTATVNVAGDDAALLAIEPGPDNPEYLDDTGDEVEFDITAGASGSQELNLDALTKIDGAITVTNNGANEVTLAVSVSGDNPGLVSINETGTTNDLTDGSTTVTLTSGSSVDLDVVIDTRGAGLGAGDEIIDTITFEASDSS